MSFVNFAFNQSFQAKFSEFHNKNSKLFFIKKSMIIPAFVTNK